MNGHPNAPGQHDQTGEIDDAAVDGEIIEPIGTGVLATLHRVEVDHQVTTAKAYPRNVLQIKQELKALVTMDEETAEECVYALPRGGKTINGPSARFADALISFWGNARSGSFITEVNKEEKYVEAIGTFQDVERNVIRQRRTRRPIADRHGRIYNADMINMTGNAACVIAERNAITNGIPKPMWGPIYDAAFAIVAGTTQTLGDKIARAKKGFLAMEIDFELVLTKIGRQDESKIVPQDIVALRGMLTALKTGEETVESVFGRGAGGNHEKVANPLKDDPAPRGNMRDVNMANTVIDEQGRVTKCRDGTAVVGPVLDQRFRKGQQHFETLTAWTEAAAGLERPVFAPAGDHQVDSGGKSSANPAETQGNAAGDPSKTASANPTHRSEPAFTVNAAAGKPDEQGPEGPGSDAGATEKTAQPAAAAAAKPLEGRMVTGAGERPYDDDESYMTFMRDKFDAATSKSAVTELWGGTRDDRNELLSSEQIETLTKDKEAKLKAIKLKGGK